MTPTLGGSLNQSFFEEYDTVVQAALNSGPDVYVIIDIVRPQDIKVVSSSYATAPAQLCTLGRWDYRAGRAYQ